jgi:hypothetical protein
MISLFSNGVLPEESKPQEKKLKLTAAESEAIFNRLAAGQLFLLLFYIII